MSGSLGRVLGRSADYTFRRLLQTVIAMPKFAANLSFLFTEVPFPERFACAARAGFAGVECLFPYAFSADDLAGWLAAAGLEMVLFNLPAGDWDGGERGQACLPGREADFRRSVGQAARMARRLGCRQLHCLAGRGPANEPEAKTRARYVANLGYAADRLGDEGITVLIEPINTRIDMPGYWLDTPEKAFGLLAEIGRPNVAVQFDIYHARIIEEDPLPSLVAHLPQIGHVQIADFPGRNEPGSGDIDFQAIFAHLDALAYRGWVGCEYRPRTETFAGLRWMDVKAPG